MFRAFRERNFVRKQLVHDHGVLESSRCKDRQAKLVPVVFLEGTKIAHRLDVLRL